MVGTELHFGNTKLTQNIRDFTDYQFNKHNDWINELSLQLTAIDRQTETGLHWVLTYITQISSAQRWCEPNWMDTG